MAAPPRPISFLRIWVAAPLQLAWSVTELRGRGRRPPDRTSMMMAGITMFAHLARARGGAERGRRRLAAQLRGRGRRPPDRTSMMMDLRKCARSRFPGWRVGALYPLARGCRAPRRMKAADAANSFLVLSSGGRRAGPPRPFFLLRIWVAASLGALVIWNHSQRVEPASERGPG